GVARFVPTQNAFEGKDVCSPDSLFFAVGVYNGDYERSLHPSRAGQAVMARLLRAAAGPPPGPRLDVPWPVPGTSALSGRVGARRLGLVRGVPRTDEPTVSSSVAWPVFPSGLACPLRPRPEPDPRHHRGGHGRCQAPPSGTAVAQGSASTTRTSDERRRRLTPDRRVDELDRVDRRQRAAGPAERGADLDEAAGVRARVD